MCSGYICVHLRCTAASWCPLRTHGAWGSFQSGGKERWFCCRLPLILGTTLGFLYYWALRRKEASHDFLFQVSLKENLSLSLLVSIITPTVKLLSQSWSGLQLLCISAALALTPKLGHCPLLTLGHSCLLGPLAGIPCMWLAMPQFGWIFKRRAFFKMSLIEVVFMVG